MITLIKGTTCSKVGAASHRVRKQSGSQVVSRPKQEGQRRGRRLLHLKNAKICEVSVL